MTMTRRGGVAAAVFLFVGLPLTPLSAQRAIYDSGGPLPALQARYDVRFYDLSVTIEPRDSTIEGRTRVVVDIVSSLPWLVLDLDTLLTVDSVTTMEAGLALDGHERRGGQLWIRLARPAATGDRVSVTVWYRGRPLVAPHRQRTWSDGFIWAQTADGQPWLGIVSVLNGADIWWPTKDHPSDEPDSLALHVTVPEPLVVAANGRLRAVERHREGTTTFHWFVSTPINNYGVTVNVAPYVVLEDTYVSVTGDSVPLFFWVLPEHAEAGRRLFPQFADHLRFFEHTIGPYPFRRDKYGVAETPYLGMEHQTVISYGSDFRNNRYGFDWLHFHELAHEWWANMLTAADWKDWWLHESFASYLEALYAEQLHGEAAYHEYLPDRPLSFRNQQPVAPRDSKTTREIYGPDIYSKGAFILHTLRFVIGRDALLAALRRMAYPDDPAGSTSSCRCRAITTDDFQRVVEAVSARDLDWFFETFLRRPALPQLDVERDETSLVLQWRTENGLVFPMPVEISIDGERRRIALPEGHAVVAIPRDAVVIVDPAMWIAMDLRETDRR